MPASDQARLCRARIEREGWVLTKTYSDRAQSGSSTLRAGYQRMLHDARSGAFDVVVAEALDRLSRDQEDVAGLYKALNFAGITLVTLAEGVISELHVGLKGTMNALFIKDLAAKTHRGLEGRVREGSSGGGLCFGYDVVRAHDARGEPVRGARSINVVEAATVLRIFKNFAAGQSPRAIAHALNRDGIRGPRGGEWGPSTINGNRERGTGVINNELYAGRLVWNRLHYLKDPRTGKRVSRQNAPDTLIVHDVPDLRIVPQNLWDAAKQRQDTPSRRPQPANRKPAFWERQRPRYLVTGLTKCGVCGSSYVKISANLFGCAGARDRGTCDNRLNIRTEALENTILDLLKTRLMEPQLFKAFCEEFHREVNRLRIEESSTVDAQRSALDKLTRRTRKLVDLIINEDAPPQALIAELRVLEAKQVELEDALASAHAPAPLIHPALAEVYRQHVASLHEALHDPDSRHEAFEIIRSLIEEIRLVPEGGALKIELRGALAGILALASESRKARGLSTPGLAEQIKMVAGRGFEPLTFRL